MPSLIPEGKQAYFDSAGDPLVGGKVYTYSAGTSTPQATYADQAGLTPNANPVILDARGEATIFWSGAYKVILKDSLDNTIWTVDNIIEVTGGNTTSSTGSMVIPAGTTAQRDTIPQIGYLRYNTDYSSLEVYTANGWSIFPDPATKMVLWSNFGGL